MTESGTEKRLDELSKRVDHGFEEVDRGLGRVEADIREFRLESNGRSDRLDDKIDAGSAALRAEMKAGFDAMGARFDSLQRTIIVVLGGSLGTIVAGSVVALLTAHL
ncbi:MAG TPA: hypothetical protein VIJ21_04690 [Solirubrobacterales bacterium]